MGMKRLFMSSAIVAGVLAASVASAATGLTTQSQKLGYAMGVETGKSFKAHHVNIDPKAFADGLQDTMSGAPAKMNDAQIQAAIKQFQQDMMKKMAASMQAVASKNAEASAAFLAANKTKAGVKTTASGLQYKVITAGHGMKPTKQDTVTVDYEGKLINGKVFDSSYKRGKPASFPVGGVITGWTEALQMMPVGSTWVLYIPSKLAYGKTGAPGAIGPNEALIFKVHLIGIKK